MFARLRAQLSYANVIATLALFVALGGVSYAAIALPKNSVGAKQIKKNAVNSKKVKNRSLGVADLSTKAVGSLKGQKGEKGDKGDAGPPGAVATWQAATVADGGSITTSAGLFGPYQDLATPGPQVNVTVPDSGLVEVYAEVDFSGGSFAVGAVGLTVDGTPASISCGGISGLLIRTFGGSSGTYSTSAPDSNGAITVCGARVPGHPVSLMVRVAPGPHTFKMVYAAASLSGSATSTFSIRRLYVAPRP